MKRIVAAALLVAGISGEAGAQVQFFNGNKLLDDCRQVIGSLGHNFCMGYVTAAADTLSRNSINGFRACIPTGVSIGQMLDVVVSWIERNPQSRHYAAIGLIANALSEAFPCR